MGKNLDQAPKRSSGDANLSNRYGRTRSASLWLTKRVQSVPAHLRKLRSSIRRASARARPPHARALDAEISCLAGAAGFEAIARNCPHSLCNARKTLLLALLCYRECYIKCYRDSMLDRYITRRPRSRHWQLTVPVPKDVQRSFGRPVVKRSLKTTDREAAEEVALGIILELKQEWARLRAGALPPTEASLLRLARDVFQQANGISQQKRAARFREGRHDYHAYLEHQERVQVDLSREFHASELGRWEEPAERVLEARGITVDREADWFRSFVGMVADVSVAAIDLNNRRDRGDLAAEPTSRVLARAGEIERANRDGSVDMAFDDLIAAFMRQWLANRATKKVTNTEQQKRATFRLFSSFWRNGRIRDVGHEDAARFRDRLKLLDPNWARSPDARQLSWADLLLRFGDQPNGLSHATMNRHMRTLQELWRWASKRGHCAGDNPFEGFNTKLKAGVNVQPYVPWEINELTALFSPPPARQDMLEVMIVGLFTGMRLDEIASLTWGRLRERECRAGKIAYFDVADAKTPAGVREVPLHRELSWLRDRPHGAPGDRIWPLFNSEGVGKKPGADASREFSTFKKKRGFNSRVKCFHSFRKNVTRIAERARVPENEWAQVFGHERGFTYAVYNPDGIDLSRKAEIISLISYPGLDIPHPSTDRERGKIAA